MRWVQSDVSIINRLQDSQHLLGVDADLSLSSELILMRNFSEEKQNVGAEREDLGSRLPRGLHLIITGSTGLTNGIDVSVLDFHR